MDKRSTSWRETAILMRSDGERSLPEYRKESRCRVCSASDRDVPNGGVVRTLIDELLMVPKTYAAIVRTIDPLMESWPEDIRISKDSIMRHAKRHLAWEQTAMRQIAERRADKSGRVQKASGRMLTAATVYEVIQQRGFDQVTSGELNPTVKDMLSATAALTEIERDADGQVSAAHLLAQLDTVIQVIREFIPEDLWPQVLRRLETEESRSGLPISPDPVWDEVAGEVGEGLVVGVDIDVQRSATTKG